MAAAVYSSPHLHHPAAYISPSTALAYQVRPSSNDDQHDYEDDTNSTESRLRRKVNVQMSSKIQQLLGENPLGTNLDTQPTQYNQPSPDKTHYGRLKKKTSTLSLHFENLMNSLSLNTNTKAPSVQVLSDNPRSYNASPIDRSPDSPSKTFTSTFQNEANTTFPRSLSRSTKPRTVSRLTREDYTVDTSYSYNGYHQRTTPEIQETSTFETKRSPKRKLRESGLIKLNSLVYSRSSSKQRSRGGTIQSEVSTLKPAYHVPKDIPLTQEQLHEELTAPRRERVRKTRQGVQQWLNEAEFVPEEFDPDQLISPSDSSTSVLTLHSQKPSAKRKSDGPVPSIPQSLSPPSRQDVLSTLDLNSQSILLLDESDNESDSLTSASNARQSKDKLFSEVGNLRDDLSINVSTADGASLKRKSHRQTPPHIVVPSTTHSRNNSGNPRQSHQHLKSAQGLPGRNRKSSVRSDRSSVTLRTHSSKNSGSGTFKVDGKLKPMSLNLGRGSLSNPLALSIPTLLTPDEYDAPSAPLPRLPPTSDLQLRSPETNHDRIRPQHLSVIDDDAFSESSVKTDLLIPSPNRAHHDDSGSDLCPTPIIDAFPVPPSANRSQASLSNLLSQNTAQTPNGERADILPFVSGRQTKDFQDTTNDSPKPISLDALVRSGASTFDSPTVLNRDMELSEKLDTITALPLVPGAFGAPSLSPKLSPKHSAERVQTQAQVLPMRLSMQPQQLVQTSILNSASVTSNPYSSNLKRMSQRKSSTGPGSGTLSWIPPQSPPTGLPPKRTSKISTSVSAPTSTKASPLIVNGSANGKASSSTFPAPATFASPLQGDFNFQLPLHSHSHSHSHEDERPKTRGRMTAHSESSPKKRAGREHDTEEVNVPPAIPRRRSNKNHLPARSISSEMALDRPFEWAVPMVSSVAADGKDRRVEKEKGIGLAV